MIISNMKTIYKILIAILGWIIVGLVWYLSSFFIGSGKNDAIGVWLFITDGVFLFGEIILIGYFLDEIK